MSVQVVCWNVLADCYTAEPWELRQILMSKAVEAVAAKVSGNGISEEQPLLLLLQEVDHVDDFFRVLLSRLGLQVLFAQRPGKHDGCLIAYNSRRLELVAEQRVDFDDLAELTLATDNYKRQSFLRHNIALLACFRCLVTSNLLTVANPHLYWNPNFPEVKAGQLKYLLDKIHAFQINNKCVPGERILVGGDFNSTPSSEVYSLATRPFQCSRLPLAVAGLAEGEARRRYLLHSKYTSAPPPHQDSQSDGATERAISFICDDTLSKFCRWLRILGISCTMLKAADLKTELKQNSNKEKIDSSGELLQSVVSEEVVVTEIQSLGSEEARSAATSPALNKQQVKAEKARKKLLQNKLYFAGGVDGGALPALRLAARRGEVPHYLREVWRKSHHL